ncbi:MAG: helical backbone metal receptor [Microscillaceae bacterium]|nr:helical backbone metal receptor [Microscillaceae bacterium]MDW8460508.1 helical backbone metal receptor [Cytophagales bacterium]
MLLNGKNIGRPPQRIISLVPSLTELLASLGLQEQIVGITKFCIHPRELYQKTPKIGGTKRFHFDRIHALNPDLIIANKEENYKEGIEELAQRYAVFLTEIITWQEALQAIQAIGELTHRKAESNALVQQIEQSFNNLPRQNIKKSPKIAYLIWHEPIMVAANQTFIQTMLQKAGFENAFAHLNRYPQILPQDLQKSEIDYIFLSSEPFPFKEKHIQYYQALCPQVKVLLVNGEMFSWYGSRLLHSAKYLAQLWQNLLIQ